MQEKVINPSTRGRGKKFTIDEPFHRKEWVNKNTHLYCGNSLDHYESWKKPKTIVSDGAYGILGFNGDTADHKSIGDWYEGHVDAWSRAATAETTLWFWNSEIGWAAAHPILEKHGWKYVNCNIWNKGVGHIAGNVNTSKIRRFPVVTEVCVQYVFEPKINNLTLQEWLYAEWKRTGLTMKSANEACGVKNAATRKYLDQGHLWYFPPVEIFEKLVNYANLKGDQSGLPYFSNDGIMPMTGEQWSKMRSKFKCPHGYTNVWDRSALRGKERIKIPANISKSAHLNQKPLDLMRLIIEASSDSSDVIWEPFGGLFSASLAARMLGRTSFSAEIDSDYFNLGAQRFSEGFLF